MTYEEFYNSIDCKFPYHQECEWKQIIDQSIEIGEDAPFLVLHEICRVPASEKLEQAMHIEIYNYWKQSFVSPVQGIVEPASLSYINKTAITDSEALDIMEKLSSFPKFYNALQVVLFACPDEDNLVDEKYENIIAKWESAT